MEKPNTIPTAPSFQIGDYVFAFYSGSKDLFFGQITQYHKDQSGEIMYQIDDGTEKGSIHYGFSLKIAK